jgi:hypothetical protein
MSVKTAHSSVKSTIKRIVKISDKYACKESTIKIMFFLLYLSVITPAIGKNTSVGIKKIKLAIESITALPVSSVIHTDITKKITSDPNNENICPKKNTM